MPRRVRRKKVDSPTASTAPSTVTMIWSAPMRTPATS
jgi:hypothetical protein